MTERITTIQDEVFIRRDGRAGRLTLNRPDALNALSYNMIGMIWRTLHEWISDDAIELVILDGTGERALCAGGDVRALYDSRISSGGTALGEKFWREEYHLNALIARYPKPFVAIMSGIVMGGGIGLSAHGQHRIVTQNSMLAMPETGIGLIPDVGGTWLLSHTQGQLGTYLALTGARMSASDAIQAGFADHYVVQEQIAPMVDRLTAHGGALVEDILEEFETTIPDSPLAAARPQLDDWFASDQVEDILARLNTTTDELAQKTRKILLRKSPLALKLTLAAIRRARHLATLEEALNTEFRLVMHLLEGGEFVEGVRAQLVDKDRKPNWSPKILEDVTSDIVERHFAQLIGVEDLGL